MKLPLITVDRFLLSPFGSYGRLVSGSFACFTVEPPWLGNAPWLSCIPAGLYKASLDEFSRGSPPYPDLRFADVPGRSDIEVHAANRPSQLSGCIATVESLRNVDGEIHGFNSKQTLRAVLDTLGASTDCYILIRE